MQQEDNKLNIAIVGLGLIGASMAKAVKLHTDHIVYGYDNKRDVIEKAIADCAIDFALDGANVSRCDVVIICLYPGAVIEYVTRNIKLFKEGALVLDSAGVKEIICSKLSKLCLENNCNFVGCHPMAGIEKSGYDSSFAHMFDGATMVLCQDEYTSESALNMADTFYKSLKFGKITYSTPIEHDRAIAFTSQLAHVVSSAYVQSNQAENQLNFSGGSYSDLTRVAKLNEVMWTELFIDNKGALVTELRELIDRLTEYADSIESEDRDKLMTMLKRGSYMKNIVG